MPSGQRAVTLEEFDEWKTSFITNRFFDFLQLEAALARRHMADGRLVRENTQLTGELYKILNSQAEIYERLATDLQYDDLFPEAANEESN